MELLAQRGLDLLGRIAADTFVDDLAVRIDEEQARRTFDAIELGDRIAVANERERQVAIAQLGDGSASPSSLMSIA